MKPDANCLAARLLLKKDRRRPDQIAGPCAFIYYRRISRAISFLSLGLCLVTLSKRTTKYPFAGLYAEIENHILRGSISISNFSDLLVDYMSVD